MSAAPPPLPSRGATPVDGARADRRRVRWLVLIAAVIVVVAVLLLLSRCDGTTTAARNRLTTPANGGPTSVAATQTSSGASPTAAPTSPAPTATTSVSSTEAPPTATATVTTPPPPGPGAADLTANGTGLLPLASAAGARVDLSRYVGQTVTARSVLVQSVPADNGFWVGTSATDRIWVQLLQRGQVSPHPVRTGDHVSFTGTMIANPAGFADSADVDASDGAAQLTAEKAHITTDKSSLAFAA